MGNSCSPGCRWWCLSWRLFVLSFFPLDVLDEIWDLTESVSEEFLTYSYTYNDKRSGKTHTCILSLHYPITLQGRWSTTDNFTPILFHLVLSSAALVELAKSTPVYSLISSSHLFLYVTFLFPCIVPCRIVFAKIEDLEIWRNHLSFRFLTKGRSSSYLSMPVWIFLQTSSLVTRSLHKMFSPKSYTYGKQRHLW